MDKSKLTIDELKEFAEDYMTIAGSCEKGNELLKEWRLESVTSASEILGELPSDLAEEFSNAIIDDAIEKKIRKCRKDISTSDKEGQT